MKTTKSLGILLIALPVLASSAFAVIRPPYPRVTSPPNTIIVIIDDQQDSVRAPIGISNSNNDYGIDKFGMTKIPLGDKAQPTDVVGNLR
jgi:hypothetical protein